MHALLYGATGYTGRLIARLAARQRLPVVLAGRDAVGVASVAAETGLASMVFALDDAARTRAALHECALVLNCAGPFVRTWRPLVDACIAGRVHYIDVTGEIDVFEAIAGESERARAAGVMLLPGAGFDVVPSDCLAAHLAGRLPNARRLLLGISGSGTLSHGTASTMIENQHRGGVIRRGGSLIRVRAGWRTRDIDFGDGRVRHAVTIPWGDVATAYHTTGIGDIEVYAAAPQRLIRAIRFSHHVRWLLRMSAVKAAQRALLRRRPAGPSATELERGESRVWGRVEDDAGCSAEALLIGPNGYRMTADAALEIVQRVLRGTAPAGFQTPASAYGADLVLKLPGTERRDVA
jgi:short subunit dehydrogenase-like uncharacterized protein